VRERVVEICKQLLEEGIRGESANKKGEEEYWVRATLVEALFGLRKASESEAEFVVAKKAALEPWMINTTEEQLAKLRACGNGQATRSVTRCACLPLHIAAQSSL